MLPPVYLLMVVILLLVSLLAVLVAGVELEPDDIFKLKVKVVIVVQLLLTLVAHQLLRLMQITLGTV